MKKDFLTVTPDSGSGNATVTVVASENIGGARSTSEEFYKLKYCSTVVYMVPRA